MKYTLFILKMNELYQAAYVVTESHGYFVSSQAVRKGSIFKNPGAFRQLARGCVFVDIKLLITA